MASNNQLEVLNQSVMTGIADQEIAKEILDELSDIDNLLPRAMGRIKMGSGGMRAFSVHEIGEEAPDVATSITCAIIHSHDCNAYWSRPMEESGDDKAPDCVSSDGIEGVRRDSGEIIACNTCPCNKYGSDPRGGNGKACKNMRRLYLMRETDQFPMIMDLPPTALYAFADYRVNIGIKKRQKMLNVLTRITLAQKKNKSAIEYNVPVFTPVGVLPLSVCERLHTLAALVRDYVKTAGIAADMVSDDYATEATVQAGSAADLPPEQTEWSDHGFVQVDEDELPPLD